MVQHRAGLDLALVVMAMGVDFASSRSRIVLAVL
jgi:hypothetical protein